MPKLMTCPGCHGRRMAENSNGQLQACPLCNGQGVMEPLYDRLPFWYPVNAVVGVGATVNTALNIEPRADFEVHCLMATFTNPFTTLMTDASGRTYQNAAVNNANQWGTNVAPFYFLAPFVLPMRTSVNFAFFSALGSTIQGALHGAELYPLQ